MRDQHADCGGGSEFLKIQRGKDALHFKQTRSFVFDCFDERGRDNASLDKLVRLIVCLASCWPVRWWLLLDAEVCSHDRGTSKRAEEGGS